MRFAEIAPLCERARDSAAAGGRCRGKPDEDPPVEGKGRGLRWIR